MTDTEVLMKAADILRRMSDGADLSDYTARRYAAATCTLAAADLTFGPVLTGADTA